MNSNDKFNVVHDAVKSAVENNLYSVVSPILNSGDKVWMTEEIKTLLRKRKQLCHEYRHATIDVNCYRYIGIVRFIIRQAKRKYVQAMLDTKLLLKNTIGKYVPNTVSKLMKK